MTAPQPSQPNTTKTKTRHQEHCIRALGAGRRQSPALVMKPLNASSPKNLNLPLPPYVRATQSLRPHTLRDPTPAYSCHPSLSSSSRARYPLRHARLFQLLPGAGIVTPWSSRTSRIASLIPSIGDWIPTKHTASHLAAASKAPTAQHARTHSTRIPRSASLPHHHPPPHRAPCAEQPACAHP